MNVHADDVRVESPFIGLTGGMGGGKTLALKFFRELGWQTMDADSLARELYEEVGGKVATAIAARWGAKMLLPDGRVDKRALAEIILSDNDEMRWVEELTHPLIWEKAVLVRKAGTGMGTVFEVPLLFEAGWETGFSAVVAVFAEDKARRIRLENRGMPPGRVEKLWRCQKPQEQKLVLADFVLVNNASAGLLKQQCESLSRLIKAG